MNNGMIEDVLPGIWRMLASGQKEKARGRLLLVWHEYCDEATDPRVTFLTLRMLDRLGFSTDAPDVWDALPDPLTIYRAGREDGFAWTVDGEVAASIVRQQKHRRVVPKSDVIAYLHDRGEAEVLLRSSVRAFCANSGRLWSDARWGSAIQVDPWGYERFNQETGRWEPYRPPA